MEKLIDEFARLQEEFHETMENNPILNDDFDYIMNILIAEIEELIAKNDEYYLKKANDKLEDIIKNVKEMSLDIKKIFIKYDKDSSKWNKIEIRDNVPKKVLEHLNEKVMEANRLITAKNYHDVKEASILLDKALKELMEYVK